MLLHTYILLFAGGLATAMPAPTPDPTFSARITKRQATVTAEPSPDGCTMTWNSASVVTYTHLTAVVSSQSLHSTEIFTLSEGNNCYCGGDARTAIVGVSSSVGNDGRETLFCKPGGTAGPPQSTAIPESSPGSPDNLGCMLFLLGAASAKLTAALAD